MDVEDLVGGLGPDVGSRVVVPGVDPGADVGVELRGPSVWVPRRSFLVVSSANQRSTRFSHDELVGVKCRTNRGWACQPALDRRGLVGGGVVEDEVHVEVGGDFGVDRASGTARNSVARWRACSAPMTLPVARSSAAYRLEVPWRT